MCVCACVRACVCVCVCLCVRAGVCISDNVLKAKYMYQVKYIKTDFIQVHYVKCKNILVVIICCNKYYSAGGYAFYFIILLILLQSLISHQNDFRLQIYNILSEELLHRVINAQQVIYLIRLTFGLNTVLDHSFQFTESSCFK